MYPDWLKLLRHQKRQGNLALTPLFIIGALQKPIGTRFDNEKEARASFILLLQCICDEISDPESVRIYTCPTLNQPVASVTQRKHYPDNWNLDNLGSEYVPIVFEFPYKPEDPADIRAAAEKLWPFLTPAILEGRFSYSKEKKDYCFFDNADIQFINEAFSYDEENEL